MASINKQRKLLLEDPSVFSDQDIAQMIRNGVATLYEISKSGGLGPYRKKKIEEILTGRVPTPPPMPEGQPGTMPQVKGNPRFPVPRPEERTPRRSLTPPPFPNQYGRQPGPAYPHPVKKGPYGPGTNLPPHYGH